jgi:hypothetical protein
MLKIVDLIIQNIPYNIFSHSALMNLIPGSSDKRYGIVKRAIASGEIIHLRKGLYCLAQRYRRHPLDLFETAQHIYGPSYISLESALAYHGWIPESVHTVTSACMPRSRDFKTPAGHFSYRRVPTQIFYDHVDALGSAQQGRFFMARPLKALADYVYIYKKDWKGLSPVKNSLRVDLGVFTSVRKQEIHKLQQAYPSQRVRDFIKTVAEELSCER